MHCHSASWYASGVRKVKSDLPVWQFIKFREYITGNQLCSVDVAVVLEQRVSPDDGFAYHHGFLLYGDVASVDMTGGPRLKKRR